MRELNEVDDFKEIKNSADFRFQTYLPVMHAKIMFFGVWIC